VPTAALRRPALSILFATATGALAAAPAFSVLSDALDANAPAATLPAGPVEAALAELAREEPQAKLLVPLRQGERNGQRFALAAWQSTPGAKDWDAMLVVATAVGARQIEITSTSKDREGVLEALVARGSSGEAPATQSRTPPSPALVASPVPMLLPMPTAWDQRFVLLYTRNPAYQPGDAARETALADGHIQYTLKLQQDGVALAAGPFEGEAEADAPIGMALLRVRDLAAAEHIAAQDPAVVAGRLRVTVRAWKMPAGRLQ
jgi:uncharacterized protein YciI